MKFNDRVMSVLQQPLRAGSVDVLQVNMGYKCNMTCGHCHVSAGPDRDEEMDGETVEAVLDVLRKSDIKNLDITGGAPELNPFFRHLVKEATDAGKHIIVHTNLTIFFEAGMEDLAEFYSGNAVEIIASLPCYTESEVDRVRGKGTYERSINAVRKLNSLGYGSGFSDRKLNLVYNPSGPFLSPPQKDLENDYKRELLGRFGITFDSLFTFANMPVGRFRVNLIANNCLEEYMGKLECAFNPATIEGLMCRRILSVGWDGVLHDCDFNQALGIPLDGDCPGVIKNFDYSRICRRRISVDEHCYGCSAGQGST
ncbi:MAG: arsenosugar biosynthesis radical SAM protein ArsS [Nitrospirae bacterium]|nr:arsenosugar biosynthesis radical SAM protein ArsS [Nitrospirota bacterium]